MNQEFVLLGLLVLLFGLFLWERWRYDLVSVGVLILAVVGGVVNPKEAFSGFGHPATITIAAVLILSRALTNTGIVEIVAKLVKRFGRRPSMHVLVLTGIGALLSSVMNNVGALAILMPVAVESCAAAKRSPAIVLMPLAFGTILGGMATLIGTPPNIVVAAYREEVMGVPFHMFDFSPVGGTVAVVGIGFVALIGWHLIPEARRKHIPTQELFQLGAYVTEVRVPPDSKAVGKMLSELEHETESSDVLIVGLIRGNQSIMGAAWRERIQPGDVLILESDPKGIDKFVSALRLELPSQPVRRTHSEQPTASASDEQLMEVVVHPGQSWVIGRTPRSLGLRSRYGVTLLAVSRQGMPYRGRLRSFRFQAGDVLLLQGEKERLVEAIARFGFLPLAERHLPLGKRHWAMITGGIFGAAIGSATLGFVPLPVALVAAALVVVLLNVVPTREVYETIDWPIVVLVGALIPVGRALEQTGTTRVIIEQLMGLAEGWSPPMLLAVLMVATMMLSDVLNNTATAVVMAPFGWTLAHYLGVNPDPFLMAVAIGASCAFLTPIGHQNNLLVMGPGGYRFSDYWRMGLPLEIVIVLIAVPMLLWIWPL